MGEKGDGTIANSQIDKVRSVAQGIRVISGLAFAPMLASELGFYVLGLSGRWGRLHVVGDGLSKTR
jgi:hypothetical protein